MERLRGLQLQKQQQRLEQEQEREETIRKWEENKQFKNAQRARRRAEEIRYVTPPSTATCVSRCVCVHWSRGMCVCSRSCLAFVSACVGVFSVRALCLTLWYCCDCH